MIGFFLVERLVRFDLDQQRAGFDFTMNFGGLPNRSFEEN
jgi:hypothetical protein